MQFSFTTFVSVPASSNPDNTIYPLIDIIPGDRVTITLSGAFLDPDENFGKLSSQLLLSEPFGGYLAGATVTYTYFDVWAAEPGPYTASWYLELDPLSLPHQFNILTESTDFETYHDLHMTVPAGAPMSLQFTVMNGQVTNHPFPWLAKVEVTVENDARTTPPDLPENFTEEEKAAFQDAADSLEKLANGTSALGASIDPFNPFVQLAGTLTTQLTNAVDGRVGAVNSAAQIALSSIRSALDNTHGLDPASLTLLVASLIDRGAAKILKDLAEDPPDGNFTEVYEAPDWTLGPIPGASPLGTTYVMASWALFQTTLNMLAATERFQGAQLAGDEVRQDLQEAAFNDALLAFKANKLALADILEDYLAELQGSLTDVDLSVEATLIANLQDYLESLTDPLVDEPFIAALIDDIETDRPYLDSTTESDIQAAIAAILDMLPSGVTGSAFAALGEVTDELAGIDTSAETPVLTGILTDSGPSSSDEITNDSTLSIEGAAEAGASVEVFRNLVSLGTTTADGSGNWTFVDTATLADGVYSYTAIATDLASNVSDTSAAMSVTVDTTNPTAPADSDVALNRIAENVSNGTAVGITASSTDSNGVSYSLADDAGGRFAISASTGVVTVANASLIDFETTTSHSITVRATDAAGNAATQTFAIEITDIAEINLVQGTSDKDKNLLGTNGVDRIDGLAGGDTMNGLDGNDTFIVDNKGDKAIELFNQGFDTVISSVSYKLGNNVENLILVGTDDLKGTGNDLNNAITGNDGNNKLTGGEGDDRLIGGEGDDSLAGNNGNDTFVFAPGFGDDSLKDFKGNGILPGDIIEFDRAIFANFTALQAAIVDNGRTLTIHAGADSITLKVKDVSLLDESDFAFV